MERAARAEAEAAQPESVAEEEDSGSETEREEDYRTTVSRPKGESAEDRKARKAAVKAERSVCLSTIVVVKRITLTNRPDELRRKLPQRLSRQRGRNSLIVTRSWSRMVEQLIWLLVPGVLSR
jgi:hypothetical protein